MPSDFPDRHFANDRELEAAIEAMDTVVEQEATIGGQASLYYKGLRYKISGGEVSAVGQGYAVVQHPDILRSLRPTLAELGVTPRGTIHETGRGQLAATLHFFNSNFDIARMIGALDESAPCHLGVVVTNSHGAPATCLGLETMAEHSDGTQYLLSDRLGSRRVRHVGRLQAQLKDLVHEMLQGLPDLGEYIRDARNTPLDRTQTIQVMRALEHGPRAREAILARRPTSAWDLYHLLCRHARRSEVRSATRLAELRECQAILDPHRLHRLIETGQQMELDEAAIVESRFQTTLDAVEATA